MRLGQPARIRVETFKDKIFNGRVTQISPMGVEKDNVTNFEVRVSIDNPGKELKANMTANAEIVLEEHADSLIVPEAAVTYDAQKNAFVEVVAPGTKTGATKVPVKLGVGNGTKIQILDGLKAGDKVILPARRAPQRATRHAEAVPYEQPCASLVQSFRTCAPTSCAAS